MKNNLHKYLLTVIILIAAVIRLWNLGNVPPSPDWDEATLGYNAFSIMQTGKDEYGKFLPLILQSFDDYKPALYVYFAIPSIVVFGLNTLAVRLPSAIFGILTVLASYFLVRELFVYRGTKRNDTPHPSSSSAGQAQNTGNVIALLTAFLLAISPWHIQFSRVAFESNVGLAFNVFAVLFFLKGLKKPWMLSLSAIFMGLNLYVYQSERIFTPLLAAALVLIYRKDLFSLSRKYIITAVVIGLIVVLPMLQYILTNPRVLSRAQGVSIFNQQTTILKEEEKKLTDDKNSNNFAGYIFHNRRVVYAKEVLARYLSHYDLKWLFITGDLPRHHAPRMGLLYIFEIPFLLIGIYMLLFGNFQKKTKLLIFSIFLLTPVPASVTFDVPHSVRTLNFLPTFQVFTALGLITVSQFIRKYQVVSIKYKVFGYMVYVLLFLFAGFNFSYYINQYFVQQNYFFSQDWQFGYKEAVSEINKIEKNYKKIIVSNAVPLDQSYIFFLYYLQYNPVKFQTEQTGNHNFGKFEFRGLDWKNEVKSPDVLFVGSSDEIPQDAKIIKTIHYLNGKPAIRMASG